MSDDHRLHPRFRLTLKVTVDLPGGPVATTSTGISRSGLSVRLARPPAIDDLLAVHIELPDGRVVEGQARCRAVLPGNLVGMSVAFSDGVQAVWDAFIDEEESTGSIWRMIGRIADSPDDALAPRGLTIPASSAAAAQRFHTAGENGLAWRLAFHKHPSDPAEESDLCVTLPGFREPGRRLVRRVLRHDVILRLDAWQPPSHRPSADEGMDDSHSKGVQISARIVELNRGGYAYVQTDPVGLISLGVGELFLVEVDGRPVFPFFTELELEQIACDAFRHDLSRPMFSTKPKAAPPPVELPPLVTPAPAPTPRPADVNRFREGYDAVRFAQTATDDVQKRRYGDREIYFHPSVWARVTVDDNELMGPTMQDEGRICVLALVGPGAPRVVRLSPQSKVSLLKPPR